MADVNAWFPPGLEQEDIDLLLEAYPGDPHRAAADAWDDYAAALDPTTATAEVISVSTGVQSVTYASGSSPFAAATDRADWHRRRSSVKSVKMGSKYAILDYASVQDEVRDLFLEEDEPAVIEAEFYPPVGG